MNLMPAHEYYPESRYRPKIFCLARALLHKASPLSW